MNRTRNVISGILLIVLAVGLILWKLNVFNLPIAIAGIPTWGLIVSAIMLVIIIHSLIDLSFGGIFIPLAVIAIIFDEPLGITAITPWVVLIAAVLLTVAFEQLFSRHRRVRRFCRERGNFGRERFASESFADEDGHISHSMKFGSATKYVRNQDLISADLSAQFGELSVFFDGAQAVNGHVDIHASVSFGEMDLYIPKDWHVDNRVSVALGNCDDRCTNTDLGEGSVTCVIDGNVSFGELKLIRV